MDVCCDGGCALAFFSTSQQTSNHIPLLDCPSVTAETPEPDLVHKFHMPAPEQPTPAQVVTVRHFRDLVGGFRLGG